MAITINQKSRYRRHASICYDVAAAMDGSRVADMVRLGNHYSDLADALDGRSRRLSPAVEQAFDIECPRCGLTMTPGHLLSEKELLPTRQLFRCEACGEALIRRKA
jgi:predicted RNA-binding Zn-ribbon protein involved in translation (DUF1610 family)